jgi:effector-binding domain-containing protein
MSYQIDVRCVEPVPTLIVRRQARPRELSVVVPAACGYVWDFVRRAGVRGAGRHVALYLNDIDLEVGVEVAAAVPAAGDVAMSATPAGWVVTTIHRGPYAGLHDAHAAIREWSRQHARRLAGPNWEIYGHWHDDPGQLRTDVFYALAADDSAPAPESAPTS